MTNTSDRVGIEGTIIAKSGKVAQVEIEFVNDEAYEEIEWFPFSQCEDLEDYEINDRAVFDCPGWLALDKGLL